MAVIYPVDFEIALALEVSNYFIQFIIGGYCGVKCPQICANLVNDGIPVYLYKSTEYSQCGRTCLTFLLFFYKSKYLTLQIEVMH